jgi:hypothetical protein
MKTLFSVATFVLLIASLALGGINVRDLIQTREDLATTQGQLAAANSAIDSYKAKFAEARAESRPEDEIVPYSTRTFARALCAGETATAWSVTAPLFRENAALYAEFHGIVTPIETLPDGTTKGGDPDGYTFFVLSWGLRANTLCNHVAYAASYIDRHGNVASLYVFTLEQDGVEHSIWFLFTASPEGIVGAE